MSDDLIAELRHEADLCRASALADDVAQLLDEAAKAMKKKEWRIKALEAHVAVLEQRASVNKPKFRLGDRVRKIKGSRWQGRVVGTYSTSLTPEGYAVESEAHAGSVQIYPAAALERVGDGDE